MATSGTYAYNPGLGELTLYAYNLIGIRNTSVVQEHMEAARMATNMLLARWSNQGVNLWCVDLVTTPLVTGQSVYSVDGSTVMILDAYVQDQNSGANIDRIILPISRTEYASYPNKEQQGYPTVYWFDRLISPSRSTGSAGPTVTLWPVPNTDNGPQYLNYSRSSDTRFQSARWANRRGPLSLAGGICLWLSLPSCANLGSRYVHGSQAYGR